MIKIRKKTLSRDYFIFAAIVAFVIIALTTWRTIQAYQTLEAEKEARYHSESYKLTNQLEESFNYLESFMTLIANDIARLDNPTPAKIAPLLEKSWPRIKDNSYNYFSWSVLDFSDPKGRILASSTHGVLDEPVMLPEGRKWVEDGPKEPGKLIISDPDVGVLTKQFVIPVGYGVKDKYGKYIGAISISFNLNNLTRKLETPAQKETGFVVLNRDIEVITQSDNAGIIDKNYFKDKVLPASLKGAAEGKLATPIHINNISYSYYKKLSTFPFIILVGDNELYMGQERSNLLGPRIEQTFLGVLFIILLYFFQRKIIRPVTKLSDAALSISNGDTDIEMPKTDIHEYQVLSNQLNNIRLIISRLNNAQSDLEEALKAKSSYLSNVSHEFRTPLNAVIGFSETMKKKIFGDIGNDKYSEYVELINEQGQYLLKLIEDILEASKIESGSMKLNEEPFSFSKLLKESIKTVQQKADDKKIQITVENAKDLPYIKADKTRIKQVLLNLLSNAVKFTSTKGQIKIRSYVDKDFVLEVSDTGIGIPKEDLKRIAQRFAQVDNMYTRKNRGTGLGMAISKDIIEIHGGSLTIESEVNVGTKIIIRLPKDRIIFGGQFSEE